jgi:hypothetical protein
LATKRQIAANRRNAQRSTGPRTAAGKCKSRRNALKHGLTAEKMLLEYEDAELFKTFHETLHKEFSPVTLAESLLVTQLATTIWRLRRAPGYEQGILNWKKYYLQRCQASHPNRERERKNPWDPKPIPEPEYINAAGPAIRIELGRALNDALVNGDLFTKLARHESHLMRQVVRIIDQLRKMKSDRPVTTETATPSVDSGSLGSEEIVAGGTAAAIGCCS